MTYRYRTMSALCMVVLAALYVASIRAGAQAPPPAAAPDPALAEAMKTLPWAYPAIPPGLKREDDGQPKRVPGSTKALTVAQINDPFGPADWYPEDHPPMPDVVARGKKPDGRACALCHLPNGLGHPESSNLAGLPAYYIVRQMMEFRSGERSQGVMSPIAKAMTDAEIQEVATYFSSIPMKPWTRVIEAETVPKTRVFLGAMRLRAPEGGTEPIGQRVVTVPEDEARESLRDSHSGFITYAPTGSLKRGQALVTTGASRTIRCELCHGAGLRGMGPVPALAGRAPIYIFKQLHGYQKAMRSGLWNPLMKDVVAKLTTDDMIAISAYTASLQP